MAWSIAMFVGRPLLDFSNLSHKYRALGTEYEVGVFVPGTKYQVGVF